MLEIITGFGIITLAIILFVLLFAGLFTETRFFMIVNRILWVIVVTGFVLVICYFVGDIVLNG